MLYKKANLLIEASSEIPRDLLLYGPKKVAFIKHDIGKNVLHARNSLDLVAELKDRNPEDWIVFRARAIDAGGIEKTGEILHGPNDNGDFFSEEQLLAENENGIKAFETFINCPIFTNHQNDDIEKARGKIINAFYDYDNHCAYVDAMIDGKAYPQLARGVREGYINDVSMGCSVKYSVCSICQNKAVQETDYCSHIKNHKGKTLNGKKVYEANYGIKFIETSCVTDGACENCTIQSVYTGPELLGKLKEVLGNSHSSCLGLKKEAYMKKEAGGEDVDKLNKALDFCKEVAEQILSSKDVDFEFLEKIGSLLSDLQNLIVELVEAGFANDNNGNAPMNGANTTEVTKTPTGGETSDELTQPTSPTTGEDSVNGPTTPPAVPTTPQPAAPPLAASSNNLEKYAKYLKELSEEAHELKHLVSGINNLKKEMKGTDSTMPSKQDLSRKKASNQITEMFSNILEMKVSENEPVIVTDGGFSVTIDPSKGIKGFANGKEVASMNLAELGDDLMAMAKINPQVVAGRLIQQIANKYSEDGDIKMSSKDTKNLKEAVLQNAPPVEEVTERQLENMSGNFARSNDESLAEGQVGVTTERQLDDVKKSQETGKGDFGRVRPEGVKENLEVTEIQLDSKRPTSFGVERKESGLAEAEGQIGKVTERQLADSGFGSERWEEDVTPGDFLPLTEKQFTGKDRLGYAVNELPEGQIEGHRQGSGKTNSERTIEAFLKGLANVVVSSRISPKTLSSIIISSDGIKEAKEVSFNKTAQLTSEDVSSIAEKSIRDEIGVNMDLANPYLDETIKVLFEDPEILSKEIRSLADEKINELKNVADSKSGLATVEEKIRASVKSSWQKRTAASASETKTSEMTITFTLAEAGLNAQAVQEGKADQEVKQYLSGLLSEMKNQPIDARDINLSDIKVDSVGNVTAQTRFTSSVEREHQPKSYNPMNNQPTQVPTEMAHTENDTQSTPAGSEETSVSSPAQETQLSAETIEKLKKLASNSTLKKEAQNPAGTTLPPATPAPAGPAPAPGGGLESLAPPSDDMGADLETPMPEEMEEESEGEAKPFGTICFVCGSQDVDAIDGHFKCNACGAEYEVEVNERLINPEKFTDIGVGKEEESMPDEENTEAEETNEAINAQPAAMPAPAAPGGAGAAGAPGGMPGLASVNDWLKTAALRYRITLSPSDLIRGAKKVASKNKGPVSLSPVGTICPQCGSKKVAFQNSFGKCAQCGCQSHVDVKERGDKVDIKFTFDPNLELTEKPHNEFGWRAKSAGCDNCEEVKAALHDILSERKQFLKVASVLEKDSWLSCMADQIQTGYDGTDSVQICASIRKLWMKTAQIPDEDGDDDMESEKDEKEVDSVDFESDENEKEDDSEFSLDEDKDESESGDEFVTDNAEESAEETEDDGLEEVDEMGAPVEEIDTVAPEATGTFDAQNIERITLEGTDAEGQEFSVEIPVSGEEGLADDSFTGDNPEEVLEITETFEDDTPSDECEDGAPCHEDEESPEFEAGEGDEDDNMMSGLFSTGLPEEFEEEDEAEEKKPMTDEEASVRASQTSELLRQGRIGSATQAAGSTLDIEKLAIALSMPLDTQVEVPRNEEDGIREDGIVAHTTSYDNTAKKNLSGNGAGSTLQEDEVVQGADRGVEVIEPKKAFNTDFIVVSKKKVEKKVDKKKKVEKKTKKTAQVMPQTQTEPIDAVSENKEESTGEKIDVPRSKVKAVPTIDVDRKDVKKPTEVRKTEYALGPDAKNLHTDVVPRDGSGDGLGGKSVTFGKEVAVGATSGNPDTYVQTYQKENQIKPTPVGNEDNHLGAAKAIQKVASSKGLDAKNLEALPMDGFYLVMDRSTQRIYKTK